MTEFNLPANTLNAEIPPMPFGYTLSRIYRILRDHSKLFLGLGAPPAVALALLYGVMFWVMFANLRPLLSPGASPTAAVTAQFAMMRTMFPSMMVAMVPMTVVFAFYLAAAFFAANKIDSGIGTSVRESFGVGWRRLDVYKRQAFARDSRGAAVPRPAREDRARNADSDSRFRLHSSLEPGLPWPEPR